jgi:hypothetical protein
MGNKSLRPRMSSRSQISSAALALALGAVVAAAALAVGSAAASPHAKAARTMNLSESANLHLTNHHGLVLKEIGTAKGTLTGPIYIQLKVTSLGSVTAQIQVYPKGGSMSGAASADYHVIGSYATFSGTLNITKGAGRYSKARGNGLSFSGTIQRSNDAVTVRVNGKLSY